MLSLKELFTGVFKMKNHIIIQDWTGNILFQGHYRSMEVDRVLSVNRCDIDHDEMLKNYPRQLGQNVDCIQCNDTDYKGDFEVYWVDEYDQRNVYAYINY